MPVAMTRGISSQGFTLVEMAIVLLIVTLLLGGLIIPLSAQVDQRNTTETQRTLASIQEALIGFALSNGRLPCPASPTSSGQESPIGGGACTNPYDGFVPAATLGISPVDSQGYALDAWNNRIRYAVTTANGNAFTSSNGMKAAGMSSLTPDLLVCSSLSTPTACNTGATLTSNAVAVIFSIGKNGSSGAAGSDETANLDNNQVFVSHDLSLGASPTGPFDDIVTWLSPNILYNRMVAAGQLP